MSKTTSRKQSEVDTNALIPVRNRAERFFLQWFWILIPSVYLFRSALEYLDLRTFPLALQDQIKWITEITLIIGIIFANLFFSSIEHTLIKLETSQNILPKSKGHSGIKALLDHLDRWLNHNLRIVMGIFSSLCIYIYYVVQFGGRHVLVSQADFSLSYLDLLLYIFPSVIYAYFVGIIVWKLVATSLIVRSIPDKFKIVVTFGHPDSAGGLLPIGKLSLAMLYVTVMPTILSACILIAPFFSTPILRLFSANTVLLFGLGPVILFAGLIGSIFALLPIFSFHRVMEAYKLEMIKTLEQISSKIVALKKKFLIQEQSNSPENLENILNELNALETFYKANENINTWPINRQILVNIWGTQVFLIGQVVTFLNWVSRVSF